MLSYIKNFFNISWNIIIQIKNEIINKMCEISYNVMIWLIVITIIYRTYIFTNKIIDKIYKIDETNIIDTTNKNNNYSDIINNIIGSKKNINVQAPHTINEKLTSFIGCVNIKDEINKIIKYFKHEKIYKHHKCNLLKGVLLMGPPGCGKTHLARIIASECNSNFIYKCGSDFTEVYVGSGQKHVRELFETAKQNKPCIIFIDEADIIIKKRYGNDSHSHEEFKSTTCKFLEEMDSIINETDILVIFSTNMPKNQIDDAIIRSG